MKSYDQISLAGAERAERFVRVVDNEAVAVLDADLRVSTIGRRRLRRCAAWFT
jgi:hypothetical protein